MSASATQGGRNK